MKGKSLQPRIFYPESLSIQIWQRNQKFYTQKQKEFDTIKPALQHTKGTSLSRKEKKATLEMRKLWMEKLIGKGKHTVKVGNHPTQIQYHN